MAKVTIVVPANLRNENTAQFDALRDRSLSNTLKYHTMIQSCIVSITPTAEIKAAEILLSNCRGPKILKSFIMPVPLQDVYVQVNTNSLRSVLIGIIMREFISPKG